MGMDWYAVLIATRAVGAKEGTEDGKKVLSAVPFTTADLAKETGLTLAVASAWIGKFQRWGYVLPEGQEESTGGRPARLYVLTRWGLRFKRSKQKKG